MSIEGFVMEQVPHGIKNTPIVDYITRADQGVSKSLREMTFDSTIRVHLWDFDVTCGSISECIE